MSNAAKRPRRTAKRLELGQYIVADPAICHGKPTFKGTRIMVWQVLDALARGESLAEIVAAWAGRVSKQAVAETIQLAGAALLDDGGNRPFLRHPRFDTRAKRMGVVARAHHDGVQFYARGVPRAKTLEWGERE